MVLFHNSLHVVNMFYLFTSCRKQTFTKQVIKTFSKVGGIYIGLEGNSGVKKDLLIRENGQYIVCVYRTITNSLLLDPCFLSSSSTIAFQSYMAKNFS